MVLLMVWCWTSGVKYTILETVQTQWKLFHAIFPDSTSDKGNVRKKMFPNTIHNPH
jgi:hypothetical protein